MIKTKDIELQRKDEMNQPTRLDWKKIEERNPRYATEATTRAS